MAFSKKTIIKLYLSDIPRRRTVQHFQWGPTFPRRRGSNCIFVYKHTEFVIFQRAGVRTPAPSSGSARGIVKLGSSTHRLGQKT